MYPILFKLGSLEIPSFGVMIALGFLVAMLMGLKKSERYGISKDHIWDLGFWLIVSGIIGGRLGHILIYYKEYLGHPEKIFTLRFEGLVSYGGIILMLIALAIWAKKHKISLLSLFDFAAAPLLMVHVFGRIGCFLNGCCYGAETCSTKLGVHFHGSKELYYPIQLLDSALSLLGVLLLLWIEKRNVVRGQIILLTLVFYSVARFVTEFGRMGPHGTATFALGLPISDAQVVSIGIILGCLGLSIVLGKRHSNLTKS